MKFAIAALIGLVSVNAVTLRQMAVKGQRPEGPPDYAAIAEMVIDKCDQNDDDSLTAQEIKDCFVENEDKLRQKAKESGRQADVDELDEMDEDAKNAKFDAHFAEADGDNNGAIDASELAAAMQAMHEAHKEKMQGKKDQSALAKRGGRGGRSATDSADTEGSATQGPPPMPSAEEVAATIFLACDLDGTVGLTLNEVETCIEANKDAVRAHAKDHGADDDVAEFEALPEEERNAQFETYFNQVAGDDNSVSQEELAEALTAAAEHYKQQRAANDTTQ